MKEYLVEELEEFDGAVEEDVWIDADSESNEQKRPSLSTSNGIHPPDPVSLSTRFCVPSTRSIPFLGVHGQFASPPLSDRPH